MKSSVIETQQKASVGIEVGRQRVLQSTSISYAAYGLATFTSRNLPAAESRNSERLVADRDRKEPYVLHVMPGTLATQAVRKDYAHELLLKHDSIEGI